MKEKLLIIGNGMASVRLLETLIRIDPDRFAITVAGAEPHAAYNRVLLSALLARDIAADAIIMRGTEWYAAHKIELLTGDAVESLDISNKLARLASGRMVAFDQCVFATGSNAFRLPLPGMDKPGVITFRDLADVTSMDAAIAAQRKFAVIGGGLLGIEAAYGLAKRGADVTLVHVMDRMMERQLDARAAAFLKRAIERKGVKVLLEKQTATIAGTVSVEGLTFADGSSLTADIVVCAVGITPNAALARAAGLPVKRGILVNDQMQTDMPGFHAIGECAEHRSVVYGLIEPAYTQAETLARALCGEPSAFESMVLATNLKVSGVPVFSAGDFIGAEGTETAILEDRNRGIYRKLVFSGNTLAGCVLVGEAEDGLWYLDLIRSKADVSLARKDLLHGRAFAQNLTAAIASCNLPRAA